jgi:arylsulfatase
VIEKGNGVIVSQGGRFGGYAFYLHEGRLTFHYNAIDPRHYNVKMPEPLTPGKHYVVARFETDSRVPGSGGKLSLQVDGLQAFEGRVEHTLRDFMNTEGFNVGCETITAVSPEYRVQDSAFEGELTKVTVTLD